MSITNGLIPATVLGTSDPIDLCKGFALFPKLGTLRASTSNTNQSITLLDVNPTIGLFRLHAHVSFTYLFGICGPSYAFRFHASGQVNQSDHTHLTMNLSNDDVAAGLYVAAELQFNIIVEVQEDKYTPTWSSPLKTTWEDVLNINKSVTVDLLSLLLKVINSLLGSKIGTSFKTASSNISSVTGGTFSFAGETTGELSQHGTTKPTPALEMSIDILSKIPELEPVLQGMKSLGGSITAGPQINLQVPVAVTLKTFEVGSAKYNVNSVTNGVAACTLAAGSAAPTDASVNTIGAEVQAQPGFEVEVGVFYHLSVAKVFTYGNSYTFALLSALGITVSSAGVTNSVSNTVGHSTIASANDVLKQSLPRGLAQNIDGMIENRTPQAAPNNLRLPRVKFAPKSRAMAAVA